MFNTLTLHFWGNIYEGLNYFTLHENHYIKWMYVKGESQTPPSPQGVPTVSLSVISSTPMHDSVFMWPSPTHPYWSSKTKKNLSFCPVGSGMFAADTCEIV